MMGRWILLITFCAPIAASETAMGMITVELGSAQVDLSAGSGVTTATLEVSFSNPAATAAPIAGYTLFLDIEPAGLELPVGVSFANPANAIPEPGAWLIWLVIASVGTGELLRQKIGVRRAEMH